LTSKITPCTRKVGQAKKKLQQFLTKLNIKNEHTNSLLQGAGNKRNFSYGLILFPSENT
jgi:ubiquinone biosynthesis protein COQ9